MLYGKEVGLVYIQKGVVVMPTNVSGPPISFYFSHVLEDNCSLLLIIITLFLCIFFGSPSPLPFQVLSCFICSYDVPIVYFWPYISLVVYLLWE